MNPRLREFRENTAHDTREAFASLTSLSLPFVYDVESGNKGLSAKSLRRIVEVYRDAGLTSDYLLFGDNDKTPKSLSPTERKQVEAHIENALKILKMNDE